MIDAGGGFSWLIDVEGAAVGAEGDGLLSGIESGNYARVAACYGVEISFAVGTDAGYPLRVGGDEEGVAVYTFRRDGLAFVCRDVVDVEPDSLAGAVAGKQDVLAIGKPARPG